MNKESLEKSVFKFLDKTNDDHVLELVLNKLESAAKLKSERARKKGLLKKSRKAVVKLASAK